MGIITFRNNTIHTSGELPSVNNIAPDFKLISQSLEHVIGLSSYEGKKKLLNIVPSFDTSICAKSAQSFEQRVADSFVVIGISRDTPFAQDRFCKESEISHTVMLSDIEHTFGKAYGVEIVDGPLAGLLARAVVVLNESNKVLYTELVSDIAHEPNYEKALECLQ